MPNQYWVNNFLKNRKCMAPQMFSARHFKKSKSKYPSKSQNQNILFTTEMKRFPVDVFNYFTYRHKNGIYPSIHSGM